VRKSTRASQTRGSSPYVSGEHPRHASIKPIVYLVEIRKSRKETKREKEIEKRREETKKEDGEDDGEEHEEGEEEEEEHEDEDCEEEEDEDGEERKKERNKNAHTKKIKIVLYVFYGVWKSVRSLDFFYMCFLSNSR
jgi:hypothetical protein